MLGFGRDEVRIEAVLGGLWMEIGVGQIGVGEGWSGSNGGDEEGCCGIVKVKERGD